MKLKSSHINHRWEPVLYQMSDEEKNGMEEMMRFYSPLGPLRKVVTYFGPGGGMPLHVGNGSFYDFDYVLKKLFGLSSLDLGIRKSLFAGGKGHHLFNMFVSSMGEMVERVFGSLQYFDCLDKLIYGSYAELTKQGFSCLGPEDLPLFAPEQYADPDLLYDRFSEDSRLAWIEGKRLLSGEPVWMPAQLVLLFYNPREDETRIGYSTTGGLSSHINEKEALYHGITELFERDAINLRWYCQIPPERVAIDRELKNKDLRNLLSVSEKLPGKLNFYYHNLEFHEIPVLTVVEIDDWLKRYAYFSGGGVGTDIEDVMLDTLNEFGQAERNMRLSLYAPDWGFAKGVESMFDVDPDEQVENIDIFFKIVAYYGYPNNIHKMDWYLKNNDSVPMSSLATADFHTSEEKWEHLIKLLEKYRIDPVVFDFTPQQMKHLRLMKTYIPELTPPYLPSLPLLGHSRYYEVPYRLGYCDHRYTFDDLNREPLPYP